MKTVLKAWNSRLTSTLAILLLTSSSANAQLPPYDVIPKIEPPYFGVRYEASTNDGELQYPVRYTVWIPPNAKTLRAVIVHQHGCGEGSCRSGLTGAFDLHWQALAAKHDCALLAATYEQPQEASCMMWCDARNGSDAAFQKGLADLGRASGHPELATVPWALWGHSGGAYWTGVMTLLHPDRVAGAWLRSGVPEIQPHESRPEVQPVSIPEHTFPVPMMLNPGTEEGVTVTEGRFSRLWDAMQRFFDPVRATGSPIGIAIDPLTGHACGNQRYLAIPWFDAILTARLPTQHGQPLQPLLMKSAWLADRLATEAFPADKFQGDVTQAVWLPNQAVATAWMHYVTDTAVPDTSAPPAPTNVKFSDGVLTWNATADFESGIQHFVIYRDGKRIAQVPEKPSNAHGRVLFQGLQYSDTPLLPLQQMRYEDAAAKPGDSQLYRVTTVNTVGLESN